MCLWSHAIGFKGVRMSDWLRSRPAMAAIRRMWTSSVFRLTAARGRRENEGMHAFLSSDVWNGISGIVGLLGLLSIVSVLCAWWRSHRLVSDGRIDLTIRKIGEGDVRLFCRTPGRRDAT